MKYAQGTKVLFDLGTVTGKGFIRGMATTELPVIGHSWIVEIYGNTVPPIFDSYPYSHITVFECMIKEVL